MGKNLKILIAEDNLTNQAVLRQMLGFLGLEAEIANNGVEAVEAVVFATSEGAQFDVVFMDMKMPRMSGVEATQAIIKRYPAKEDRPIIIACTANAFAYNRKECADAGMDHYIAKPIIIPELEKILKGCFPDWSPTIKSKGGANAAAGKPALTNATATVPQDEAEAVGAGDAAARKSKTRESSGGAQRSGKSSSKDKTQKSSSKEKEKSKKKSSKSKRHASSDDEGVSTGVVVGIAVTTVITAVAVAAIWVSRRK